MVDLSILSRLKHRVELGVVTSLFLSCTFSAPVAAIERSENENREPEPAPQVELPAHSDYSEAKALLLKRKWEEAAIVLRTVLKKNPENFAAAMDLAKALVYVGRREEALTLLSRILQQQQSSARKTAAEARIRVMARTFLTQETAQIYQTGLNFLTQQRYRNARERFDKALSIEPDNIQILVRMGECLVLDGDFDSAAERLRLARRLDPREPEVSLWLGRALHQRGELGEALSELKFARDGLPGSERAPIWYSEALLAGGNRKGAVQVLEADVDARPLHLLAIVELARMRTALSRDGIDALWGARKDLQVALSRIADYASEDTKKFEGELGVEFPRSAPELKERIEGLLAQLDGKLRDAPARGLNKR